ncbi:hypothetical protein J4E91_011091 [Alternaria rosae]|nr:hypothetical protein J4E91_011091 [Alternaria rosae]
MQKALGHRADFFDDFSSESEWEDSISKTIQSPTASSGLGLRDIPYDIDGDVGSTQRGRNRQRSTITSLPRLANALADSSGSGTEDSGTSDEQVSGRGTNHARKMSLTRLDKNNYRFAKTIVTQQHVFTQLSPHDIGQFNTILYISIYRRYTGRLTAEPNISQSSQEDRVVKQHIR